MHIERRVVVTGGAEFIGSHFCEHLSRRDVTFSASTIFSAVEAKYRTLLDNSHFEVLRHDVTVPLYVEADEIYNLACPASPLHYQRDPVQTTKTSVHGAINMLGLSKQLRAQILQASTSEIYGDPQTHPQPILGNVNPIGLRSCYDEAKRCAETLFFDYHRQHRSHNQGLANFQYLWPADACRGRPSGIQLHRPGAQGGAELTVYGTGPRPAPSATSTI